MSYYGFLPTHREVPFFKELRKPYWKLTVNTRNLDKSFNEILTDSSWNKDVTSASVTRDYKTYIGLNSNSANATLNFTKDIVFEDRGYYLLLLETVIGPSDTGSVSLYINDVQQGTTKIMKNNVSATKTLMYPLTVIAKGTQTIRVTVTKQAYVRRLYIYKIEPYVACSDPTSIDKYSINMGMLDCEFTENSVNEMNILSVNIPLEDKLYNESRDSIIFTDFKDPATLILGQNGRMAIPKFGGYTIGRELTDDTITLKIMDRFLDTYVQDVSKNFAIGNPPATDYVKYGNIKDLATYLITTLEYPLDLDVASYDYGFGADFKDNNTYDNINVGTKFTKTQDTSKGNPPPSVLFKPNTSTGAGEIILWSGTAWDSAVYPKLFFPYTFYGLLHALPVNIAVSMYKAGQNSGQAVVYNIVFNGDTNPSNNIGTVAPDYRNSGWPGFLFNLKSAFDTFLGGNKSTEYHITKISLVGTVSSDMASNPNNYGIYIPYISSYKEVYEAPKLAISEAANVYEALQKICADGKHVAIIQAGKDRTEDKMVLMPQSIISSTILADEKINVRGLSNRVYQPLTEELCTQRYGGYVTTNTAGVETKHEVYKEDNDAIFKFGRVKSRGMIDDVTTSPEAQKVTDKYVDENKIKLDGAELELDGNILITPIDYLLTSINGKRLTGTYPIKTITQKLDVEGKDFYATLGINSVPNAFIRKQYFVHQYVRNQLARLY